MSSTNTDKFRFIWPLLLVFAVMLATVDIIKEKISSVFYSNTFQIKQLNLAVSGNPEFDSHIDTISNSVLRSSAISNNVDNSSSVIFPYNAILKQKVQKTVVENTSATNNEKRRAVIAFWNKPFANFPPYFPFNYCYPNNDCQIEYGSKYATTADAVVIHPIFSETLPPTENSDFKLISKTRRQEQIFAFFQWESPEYHHSHSQDPRTDYRVYDNFFNETMTYRKDSTMFFPYGSTAIIKFKKYYDKTNWATKNVFKTKTETTNPIPISNLTQTDLDNFFQNNYKINLKQKTGDVIAVVSNCRSQYRGSIIQKLDTLFRANGVKFDVFGRCAKVYQKLPTKINSSKKGQFQRAGLDKRFDYHSLPKLIKKYKFYLAIENSRCKNYITEKTFHNAFLSDAVPIVAGTVKNEYLNLLPDDSFLHVDDFSDVEELSEKIKYLVNNDEQYLEYFSWLKRDPALEKYSFATMKDFSNNFGWCKLCKIAKESRDGQIMEHNIIPDVESWWYGSRAGLSRTGENAVCKGVRASDSDVVKASKPRARHERSKLCDVSFWRPECRNKNKRSRRDFQGTSEVLSDKFYDGTNWS